MANLWPDGQKSHKRPCMRVSLQHKTKPNSHPESCMVNVAGRWRGRTCECPGRSVRNALKRVTTAESSAERTEVPMANSKSNASEKNYFDIPVWRRYTLTIEEAAGYYHIGEGKLRMLIDQNPHEDFYVMNGNWALIKREKFERYLDQATAV